MPVLAARGWLAGVVLAVAVSGAPAAAVTGAAVQHSQPLRAGQGPAPAPPAVPFRQLAVAGARPLCPPATQPGVAQCQTLETAAPGQAAAGRVPGPATRLPVSGYGPASLRAAYRLSAASLTSGRGATVAIVDAYGDPKAAADLAAYRAHYGLPACGLGTGCLRIVNEYGAAAPLPPGKQNWARDMSLGLDTISAICPNCRLLLVEAASNSMTDLGIAEDTAVASGAAYVDNSWSGLEFTGQGAYNQYFNHPGAAIVFAAGDGGYNTAYPVGLQYVTAVGGTTLRRGGSGRGWTETAWRWTSSGCTILEAKPSWQRADATAPGGCLNRTVADVAANANPATGIAVYDSYQTPRAWSELGGTPAAAAIITAVYALAGPPAPRTYPASYPYRQAGLLFDVTAGSDGSCDLGRRYLCAAGPGYDGPTGLGTPNGPGAFSAAGAARQVTVADPGVLDVAAGTPFRVRITGLDARAPAVGLSYRASGLPAGLSVRAVPGSSDARITGTLPPAARTYHVTVTATDPGTGEAGSMRFAIVASGPLSTAAAGGASLALAGSSPASAACLDAGAAARGTIASIRGCDGSRRQQWTVRPLGAPGGASELISNGLCLDSTVVLAQCAARKAGQSWRLGFGGLLENSGSGGCLGTVSGYHNPLSVLACGGKGGYDRWAVRAVSLRSGVPGLCAALPAGAGGGPGAAFVAERCGGAGGQALTIQTDGSIRSPGGLCMIGADGRHDGTVVRAARCHPGFAQDWLAGPGGELINEGSGLCLDDPGASAVPGTPLVLQDCYGLLGEVWAVG